MRKRYDSRREQKKKELSLALTLAENEICCILDCDMNHIFSDCTANTPWFSRPSSSIATVSSLSLPILEEIDWGQIPEYIDPASGELEELRAKRKRQQLESLVLLVEDEIRNCVIPNPHIIDFGAGSGHLGLIIAYRNPHVTVTLLERKEYSVTVAMERIEKCHLLNVTIDQRDVIQLFSSPSMSFQIGVSLHSCGQLTDLSLRLCSLHSASFVLTPCCYGQVAHPPPIIDQLTGQQTPSLPMTQFSSLSLSTLKPITDSAVTAANPDLTLFPLIISSADYSNCFDETESSYEKNQISFLLAKRCMRVIDFDRLIHICCSISLNSFEDEETKATKVVGKDPVRGRGSTEEQKTKLGEYIFRMTSLFPLTCSPKNNVIIGRYLSQNY
jgi:hypothetical protein